MSVMFGTNISPLQGFGVGIMRLHRASPCVNRSYPFGASGKLVVDSPERTKSNSYGCSPSNKIWNNKTNPVRGEIKIIT